jgi:hypothetical protein
MIHLTPPGYVPLWLTAEEHTALFTNLLESIDEQKANSLRQMLRRADARAKEWAFRAPASENGPSSPSIRKAGLGSSYKTILLWLILIALFIAFHNIFSRQ